MNSKAKQALHRLSRPGEGYAVDIVRVGATRGNEVQVQMDLGACPVPERQYPCDAVGLLFDTHLTKLLFGQRKPVGEGWLSLLVVQLSAEAVNRFIDSVANGFQDRLESSFAQIAPVPTEFTTEAVQTVVLRASIVLTGFSGSDGCLDFYYTSPFSVEKSLVLNKMHVDPVVRVSLPSPLILSILRELKKRAATLEDAGHMELRSEFIGPADRSLLRK
jgi:hypothetical protein